MGVCNLCKCIGAPRVCTSVLFIGIVPGPKEAKKTINSFLTPLVFELQEAWNHGFSAMSPQNIPVRIKLDLSCVSCDIPASRKVVDSLVTMHH